MACSRRSTAGRVKLTERTSTRSSASARIDNTISIVSVKPATAYVIAKKLHADCC